MNVPAAELASRLMKPDRPRLAEALAATKGLSDAREAWEGLATRGVIPEDWIDAPDRAFVDEVVDMLEGVAGVGGGPVRVMYASGRAVELTLAEHLKPSLEHALVSTPPTLDHCVALASDPAGVLTAEALAREAVARMRPFGGPTPHRVVWRGESDEPDLIDAIVFDLPLFRYLDSAFGVEEVRERLERKFRRSFPRAGRVDDDATDWQDVALGLCVEAGVWKRACADGWHTRTRRGVRSMLFSDALRDPFEPLLAMLGAGYAPEAFTADAIFLALPMLAP